jgi:hypothetical protein
MPEKEFLSFDDIVQREMDRYGRPDLERWEQQMASIASAMSQLFDRADQTIDEHLKKAKRRSDKASMIAGLEMAELLEGSRRSFFRAFSRTYHEGASHQKSALSEIEAVPLGHALSHLEKTRRKTKESVREAKIAAAKAIDGMYKSQKETPSGKKLKMMIFEI